MSGLYIQITDKCNMRCAHCCFSCTGRGTFMSREHMVKVLELLRGDETESFYPTIGGGEPTLHPDCIEFIKWVAQECESSSYGAGFPVASIITNGSKTTKAIQIAKLARQGEISARLSYDVWHDLSKVSKRVWKAFQAKYDDEIWYNHKIGYLEPASDNDARSINPNNYFITPHGRALENNLYNHPWHGVDSCCCEAIFITPDGTIWQCGCRQTPMGHLDNLNGFWEVYHANLDEDHEIPCSKKKVLQRPLPNPFALEYA